METLGHGFLRPLLLTNRLIASEVPVQLYTVEIGSGIKESEKYEEKCGNGLDEIQSLRAEDNIGQILNNPSYIFTENVQEGVCAEISSYAIQV